MNVMFICNGNVARSQEAEAFFRHLTKGTGHQAASAGVEVKVGQPIDPTVQTVMQEVGIDVSGAQRKMVNQDMVNWADLIVALKPAHELPDFAAKHKHITTWEVPDPRLQPIEIHRQVRDEIKRRVEELVASLGDA